MTAYEQGFLTKCAECGIPEQVAGAMLKKAVETPNADGQIHWSSLYSLPKNILKLFRRADSKLFNAYGKHLKNPVKNESPITVKPDTGYPGYTTPLPPVTDALTPYGSNIVQRTILDKIPKAQHTPALSNAVWNVWSGASVPSTFENYKAIKKSLP